MHSNYTTSSVLHAPVHPLAASSLATTEPSAFMFSQLSSFSLITAKLSGFCKELKTPVSARRHCTKVIIKVMKNPHRLHNLFIDFLTQREASQLWKEGLGSISPRGKNRTTKPKHIITKKMQHSFSSCTILYLSLDSFEIIWMTAFK